MRLMVKAQFSHEERDSDGECGRTIYEGLFGPYSLEVDAEECVTELAKRPDTISAVIENGRTSEGGQAIEKRLDALEQKLDSQNE